MGGLRRRQESIDEEDDLNDGVSSRGKRISLIETFRWLDTSEHRKTDSDGRNDHRFIIHPKNSWYKTWEMFILMWAIYSSLFTPMEFGFFRGLPKRLLYSTLLVSSRSWSILFFSFLLPFVIVKLTGPTTNKNQNPNSYN